MMSSHRNVLAHLDFLKSLAKAKKVGNRRLLLARAGNREIKALQEITHNIVKKRLPLSPCQLRALERGKYRKPIKEIAKKTGSVQSKRNILIQKGGFLQYILPAALAFLTSKLVNRL